MATNDSNLQMKVVSEMLDFLAGSFHEDSVPSHIGTDRDLLVQSLTGCDPYKGLKHDSNVMALSILGELNDLIEEAGDSESRFRQATLIAAAANAIEFDVSGREFSLEELRDIINKVESDLAIDQVDEFRNLCKDANDVLYLMDNAGEIVLDMILIAEIQRLGPRVAAVVKGGPVLNDATMTDAKEVGLHRIADSVIDTGAAAIGVNLERNSDSFKSLFSQAELVVAKGMGNYESLTELNPTCPIVHIFRTKCPPVAQHVGAELNKNVVLIRKPL